MRFEIQQISLANTKDRIYVAALRIQNVEDFLAARGVRSFVTVRPADAQSKKLPVDFNMAIGSSRGNTMKLPPLVEQWFSTIKRFHQEDAMPEDPSEEAIGPALVDVVTKLDKLTEEARKAQEAHRSQDSLRQVEIRKLMGQIRSITNQRILDNIDLFLALAPRHLYKTSNCSDTEPKNDEECVRCALMRGKIQNFLSSGYEFSLKMKYDEEELEADDDL